MIDKSSFRIGIVGAGKVGSALAKQLIKEGWKISTIVNRTISKGNTLARFCHADFFSSIPSNGDVSPDIWIISVNDDEIPNVISQLIATGSEIPAFHTSGSFDTGECKEKYPRIGSLYPLQSFSHGKEVDFKQIPFCVSAFEKVDLDTIRSVAGSLSDQVFDIRDEDRLYLHLAAVFVNNFTNALCHIASSILDKRDIPFHLLQPLLLETATKLALLTPTEAQTGPALRGDRSTLQKHGSILQELPEEYQVIYEILSDYISNYIK